MVDATHHSAPRQDAGARPLEGGGPVKPLVEGALADLPDPMGEAPNKPRLGEYGLRLVARVHRSFGAYRHNVGPQIDRLTVREARELVDKIDEEMSRAQRLIEVLLALRTEITRSVQ